MFLLQKNMQKPNFALPFLSGSAKGTLLRNNAVINPFIMLLLEVRMFQPDKYQEPTLLGDQCVVTDFD